MPATRRSLMALGAAAAALPLAAFTARRSDLSPTPGQRIGPFYPEVSEGENRLRMIRGEAPPGSRRVELSGRILDRSGAPIGGAMVLVWQADSSGRYDHSRDASRAERTGALAGHGMLRTAADGSFGLTTLRPGAYPDDRSRTGRRTPHIHFEIIGEEGRLITEMYFPGEPLNDGDANIAEMIAAGHDPARLTATSLTQPGDDVEALGWDVVLAAR